jgi:hypothetical protein
MQLDMTCPGFYGRCPFPSLTHTPCAGDNVTLSSSSSFTYQSVVLALDQSSEPFDGAVYMALTMAGTDQVCVRVCVLADG